MRPLALSLLAVLLLAGCDSLTGPALDETAGAQAASEVLAAGGEARTALVSVCLPGEAGTFHPSEVLRSELPEYLRRGAEIPGGGLVDEACRFTRFRLACPCFTAGELAEPLGGDKPSPYLLFDTFNWWGLDYRRTEVRSVVDHEGAMFEETASVYITPVGQGETALICHRAGVRLDAAGTEYYYTTKQPAVRQAEVCRNIIYAFAAGLECQGPACGLPYTPEQLDPSYPAYDLDRAQPPLHLDLKERIEAVRAIAVAGTKD